MRDRNVIAWSVVSLFGFLVVNFLMCQSFVQVRLGTSNDFWKSSIIALVLYAIPIVLAALNWRPALYILGIIIAIYSIGLLSVIMTMWTGSQASTLIRVIMSALSVGTILINAYWLVLVLRVRKAIQDRRDRRRYGK